MDNLERTQHLLHSQLPAFARKLDWTRQIIEDGMTKITQPYIAFSGGIDSTVLLDLFWQAGHPMPVLWGDDAWDFPENLAFLKATEQRYGFRLTRIRSLNPWRDWCLEMDRPDLCDDPAALGAWFNPHEWDETWPSLTHGAPLHGYTGVFLGMLAKESRSRQYVLKNGYKPLYQVKSEGGMWHCSPLAAWSKSEVWAYAISHELPYNPVYDKLAELGVPLERRRVAPLTCFRVLHLGSGVVLRSGWGELWNTLACSFPRIREYS